MLRFDQKNNLVIDYSKDKSLFRIAVFPLSILFGLTFTLYVFSKNGTLQRIIESIQYFDINKYSFYEITGFSLMMISMSIVIFYAIVIMPFMFVKKGIIFGKTKPTYTIHNDKNAITLSYYKGQVIKVFNYHHVKQITRKEHLSFFNKDEEKNISYTLKFNLENEELPLYFSFIDRSHMFKVLNYLRTCFGYKVLILDDDNSREKINYYNHLD